MYVILQLSPEFTFYPMSRRVQQEGFGRHAEVVVILRLGCEIIGTDDLFQNRIEEPL